jgi:hypothetical protein
MHRPFWEIPSRNVSGSTAPGTGNVISASGQYGVIIDAGSFANVLEGNPTGVWLNGSGTMSNFVMNDFSGTDATGT